MGDNVTDNLSWLIGSVSHPPHEVSFHIPWQLWIIVLIGCYFFGLGLHRQVMAWRKLRKGKKGDK